MRLEVFTRLLELERQKKQRLQWYLQEVLLEKESLMNEMKTPFLYASQPAFGRQKRVPSICTTSAPLRSHKSSTTASPSPTRTAVPSAHRCSSCGKHPVARGTTSLCRCFESVRKRQRRLSIFVRTGALDDNRSAPEPDAPAAVSLAFFDCLETACDYEADEDDPQMLLSPSSIDLQEEEGSEQGKEENDYTVDYEGSTEDEEGSNYPVHDVAPKIVCLARESFLVS